MCLYVLVVVFLLRTQQASYHVVMAFGVCIKMFIISRIVKAAGHHKLVLASEWFVDRQGASSHAAMQKC